MKTCSIPGCGRIHCAKGFCMMHYYRFYKCNTTDLSPEPLRRHKNGKNLLKCSVESCKEPQYSSGYCRKHYGAYGRNGENLYPQPHKCAAPGCEALIKRPNILYCSFHSSRIRGGVSLTRPKGHARGDEVWTWKGGISKYKDHYTLKRNRLEALKKAKYKCSICGVRANYTHHIDGSKDNHIQENLMPVCAKCHIRIHRIPERNSQRFRGSRMMKMSDGRYRRILKDEHVEFSIVA